MSTCKSCGVSIPEGKPFCSMCYGDPDYGRDGLYRKWLEDQNEYEDRRHQEQEEGP